MRARSPAIAASVLGALATSLVAPSLVAAQLVPRTQHPAPTPTPLTGTPAAPPIVPASVDPRAELTALAKRALARQHGLEGGPRACTRWSGAERTALTRRALAWIDAQFPDEQQGAPEDGAVPGIERVVHVACKSGSAAILDIGQDRAPRRGHAPPTRRNYILRIDRDRVEVVASRGSSPSTYWMEWADEGHLAALGEVDLDGDGALDLVWSDQAHEGGDTHTYDALSVTYATGATVPIARITDLADARVVSGRLLVAATSRDGAATRYACVARPDAGAPPITPCPEAAPLQRLADRADAATALQLAPRDPLPDRELVTRALKTLGERASAAALAALPATSAEQHAQRDVESALADRGLDDVSAQLFDQPRPAATAYLDELAAQLGDQACAPAPLSDDAGARLTAWIATQDRAPEDVLLTPECGAYAWAEWNAHGDPDHREELVALDGAAPVRVIKLASDTGGMAWRPHPHRYEGVFFRHGPDVIGMVIRNHNLFVIAGDRVVARSHGDLARYAYDPRWRERSIDLVVDSGTIFHATATGLEKLDRAVAPPAPAAPAAPATADGGAALRALVQAHRRYLAALEQLTSVPSPDPAYLAALREIGASAALIAECKAL